MAEKKKGGRTINLPNTLTLIRIGLVPLIVTFILIPWKNTVLWNVITAAVFGIAALTDLFDGAIARGTNQTSIRMVASKEDGTVIAANFAGKLKTAFSCATVVVILLEDVIFENGGLAGVHLLSYITLAITVILTVWSGITYLTKYFTYIDPRR